MGKTLAEKTVKYRTGVDGGMEGTLLVVFQLLPVL